MPARWSEEAITLVHPPSISPSLHLSLPPFIYLSIPSPLSLPSSFFHFRFSEVKIVTLSARWSEQAITLAHPPFLPLSLSPFIYLSIPSPLSLPSSFFHFRFSEVKIVTLSARWSEEAITLAHPPSLYLSLHSSISSFLLLSPSLPLSLSLPVQ